MEFVKEVKDTIHNYIPLSPLALKIIQTPEFQRLGDLKQLGLVNRVYTTANHTRKEHSIGVYHLTGKYLEHLEKNSAPELNIKAYLSNGRLLTPKGEVDKTSPELLHTEAKVDKTSPRISFLDTGYAAVSIRELIMIGGLIHDIGHVAFSHFFDDNFTRELKIPHHEERGIAIFRKMVDKYKLTLTSVEVDFIAGIVLGDLSAMSNILIDMDMGLRPHTTVTNNVSTHVMTSCSHTTFCELFPKAQVPVPRWMLQIVNNKSFELDTDKLDYLVRDSYYTGIYSAVQIDRIFNHCKISSDGDIIFAKKIVLQLYDVFMGRFRLHKEVYRHKTVIAIEILVKEYLRNLFKIPFIIDLVKNEHWEFFSDDILNMANKIQLLAPKGQVGKTISEVLSVELPEKDPNVKTSFTSWSGELSICVKIKERIDTRNIPKLVNKVCYRDVESCDNRVKGDNEVVVKLGLCSRGINPLNDFIFYDEKTGMIERGLDEFSNLFATNVFEIIVFSYRNI